MSVEVRHGDSLQLLAAMESASVDAICTDPPYGLEFMNEEWDSFRTGRSSRYASGGELGAPASSRYGPVHVKRPARRCLSCGRQEWSGSPCQCAVPEWEIDASPLRAFGAWCEAWGREARRVLKPGGHIVAFGSTRTWHRLSVGLEDAGFEMRDTLAWLFGQGYPKSHNLSGEHEGWGTTLKPAYEPIVLARRSPAATIAENMAQHGVGALHIDATRVAGAMDGTWGARQLSSIGYGGTDVTEFQTEAHPLGRWPANVVADEVAGALIDAEAGERGGGYGTRGVGGHVYGNGNGVTHNFTELGQTVGYGDAGGPSRFFYCPKASTAERSAGLPAERENGHKTVKPVALMRWLLRLVAPRGAFIVDPFGGSGTTGCAMVLEGMRGILMERDAVSVENARDRIAWWARREGESDSALERAVAGADVRRKRGRGLADAGQLTLG